MFVGLHVMLGQLTPELAINEDEGKTFMRAAQNVMRHYSVQTTQKTLDWIALIGVTTALYAPRATAIGIRRRNENRPRRSADIIRLHPDAPQTDPQPVSIMPDEFNPAGE